jgi:hypothetical protein
VTGGLTKIGWGALIAAKVACCGVLLLFLTGALTLNGVLGWFRDGNLGWFALAGAGVTAGVFLWLRHRRRDRDAPENPRRLERKGAP